MWLTLYAKGYVKYIWSKEGIVFCSSLDLANWSRRLEEVVSQHFFRGHGLALGF